MLYFILFAIAIILMPHSAYAWGPGMHINISLNILDQLYGPTASIILANLNEYLYGALAPDFIVGKKYVKDKKHTHSWDIGFDILNSAAADKDRAFGLGYLTHLASDSAAHGIMIPRMVENEAHKNAKHFYIEVFADAYCDVSYKHLAKKILDKHNKKLDDQFKCKVDSVLFGFALSRTLSVKMAKLSFNKQFTNIVLNRHLSQAFRLKAELEVVQKYAELSKKFSIDVIEKKEKSEVVNISAISR